MGPTDAVVVEAPADDALALLKKENAALAADRDALKLKLAATEAALAQAIASLLESQIKLAAAESRRDVLAHMHKVECEVSHDMARDFLFLWWASMRTPDEMVPPNGVCNDSTRSRLRLQYEEERERSSPVPPPYTDEERKAVRRAVELWGKYVKEKSE